MLELDITDTAWPAEDLQQFQIIISMCTWCQENAGSIKLNLRQFKSERWLVAVFRWALVDGIYLALLTRIHWMLVVSTHRGASGWRPFLITNHKNLPDMTFASRSFGVGRDCDRSPQLSVCFKPNLGGTRQRAPLTVKCSNALTTVRVSSCLR